MTEPELKPIRHGTPSAYGYHKCRCDTCRAGNTARCRAIHDRLKAIGLAPGDYRHGSLGAYKNWGCRCDKCCAKHSADLKAREPRRKRAA
jgi:hypothetical protein